MKIDDLNAKFSGTTENRRKAIFSTILIAANRLQTLFDNHIPEVSLKQFMLLSVVRQSEEPLTLTQLGSLLGCSRQNVRKVADVLQKKGFVTIRQNPQDTRAATLCATEKADGWFRDVFPEYQEKLRVLFEVYTDGEIETLFRLLSRLYAGIDHLEKESEETR